MSRKILILIKENLKILHADSHPGSKKGTSWLSVHGRDGRIWRLLLFRTLREYPRVTLPTVSELPRLLSRILPMTYVGFFSAGPTLQCPLPHGATAPSGPGPPHYRGFTITLRHTTLCSTALDEWSALPLPDNTHHVGEADIHAPGEDSNPQSQQVSGRKPTKLTVRSLGSDTVYSGGICFWLESLWNRYFCSRSCWWYSTEWSCKMAETYFGGQAQASARRTRRNFSVLWPGCSEAAPWELGIAGVPAGFPTGYSTV